MRRRPPLRLVGGDRVATRLLDGGRRIRCPGCSERLGVDVVASVTIAPSPARREVDGRLTLDETVYLCAGCAKQGVTTRL